jgi:putative flippase GtrA
MIQKVIEIVSKNTFAKEAFRFSIVGLISTSITYGVYYLLSTWINATIAFTVAYILAFIVNFILTTKFTFAVEATAKRGIGFIISNIINYSLSVSLLNLFIWFGLSKSIAPLPMFAITIPLNFIIVRWLVK